MSVGIVKSKSGEIYASPVFALKYAGWKSAAIVFNESFDKIKKIKMWNTGFGGIRRNVFVIENDFDEGKGKWTGYDWVLRDKRLFKAIRFKREASIALFPSFQDYCKKISFPDYFELKTDRDVETLEEVSLGFHDALIEEYTENEDRISIRFDTTWDCLITVIFEGVIAADFKEKVGQIFDSEIKKTDDGFLFSVTEGIAGWIDGCDYGAETGEPYIRCEKMFWQIEIV